MASLDRSELLIVFASVLIGSAAGGWSGMHWGNSIVSVASTLIGTVVGYYVIVAVLRAVGHPVE